MSHRAGLQFKRFDLHTHTSASSDFEDGAVTGEQVVKAALSRGLDGIAVTDHQTAKMVDAVIGAAKGGPLTVFPGVEVKVAGGKTGVHVILLFDVDKDTNHIHQFLNKLGLYQKDGQAATIISKSLPDVLLELQVYDPTAIAVLAHCHSSQGVTNDIRGDQRADIFDRKWVALRGAEANESDFTNEERRKKGTRVIDLFDGAHPEYHNKALGVYQASDSHSLNDIGTSFTYFKVDDNPTIEDLRQCLVNRDSRIRQSFEYAKVNPPYIADIRVKQGFLDEQVIRFHRGLNSILGGKGSGKSLSIEFLRFALDQSPLNADLLLDHNSKLEKCLKTYGEVCVTVVDDSEHSYEIVREFKPLENSPVRITDLTENTEKSFAVSEVFPVLFLSQNEIVKIAEDRSGTSIRNFIDKFFDFRKYHRDIEKLTAQLRDIDSRFAESIRAHLAWKTADRSIATLSESLNRLDRQLQNEVFDKYKNAEAMAAEIKIQSNFADEIVTGLDSWLRIALAARIPEPEDLKNPQLKRLIDKNDEIVLDVRTTLTELAERVRVKRTGATEIQAEWSQKFGIIKGEYEQTIKGSGDKISLDSQRQIVFRQLESERRMSTSNSAKATELSEVSKLRDAKMKELLNVRKAYFDERRSKCERFTELSNGSLRVTISEGTDTSSFMENLATLKVGSFLRKENIEKITSKISPAEFVTVILRYEYAQRNRIELLQTLADKADIDIDTFKKLAVFLLDSYKYEDVLQLLYDSAPDDRPSVEYKVGSSFKPLDELSVGQKATSLLLIALSDGKFPIVIDQPEDSLDLKSIWNDVCSRIRGTKDERQFILTTHNSSVAVASDTDKFTIVQATADRGEVLFSGSLNSPHVKREVIDYLEGGEKTYDLKRSNYNLH